MLTYQALMVLLLLLPGFFSRTIIILLSPRKQINNLQIVVESFLLSFITYLLVNLISTESLNAIILQMVTFNKDSIISDISSLFLSSLTISIIIGILFSIFINNDLFHPLLRYLKITTSTSRSSTWLDVFSEKKIGM